MEKLQDPVNTPKLMSAQVNKQKDLTGSEKLKTLTHSTSTQINTSEKTNIPI